MNPKEFRRRLQFSKREYQEMLVRMSSADNPAAAELRARPRFDYTVADIPLCIEHPEGGTSFFLVFGRNISRRGISVLHGGFVHPGSPCRVVLGQTRGEPLTVDGEVRHCRLFAGSCHEIGILFHQEVDTSLLVGQETDEEGETVSESPHGFAKTDGAILVAESFVPDHILLKHHLSIFGLDISIAETPGACLDQVQRKPIDVILYGLSLGGPDGVETIAKLRSTGFKGPILVLSAETDAVRLDAARRAGSTEIIAKPYNIDLLVAQLKVHLGEAEPERPLYSTACDQPGMPPLISEFVKLVKRLADQVERTFVEEAWTDLREYVCQLKGSGCSYGFQHITVAAIAVLNAMDQDVASDAMREMIHTLIDRCRSLEFNQPVEKSAA